MSNTETNFDAGRTYSMTSVCDSNCRWTFKVVRRTAKSVWLMDDSGEISRRVISRYNGEEQVFPLGKYSMAPILGAGKVYEQVGKLEVVR